MDCVFDVNSIKVINKFPEKSFIERFKWVQKDSDLFYIKKLHDWWNIENDSI